MRRPALFAWVRRRLGTRSVDAWTQVFAAGRPLTDGSRFLDPDSGLALIDRRYILKSGSAQPHDMAPKRDPKDEQLLATETPKAPLSTSAPRTPSNPRGWPTMTYFSQPRTTIGKRSKHTGGTTTSPTSSARTSATRSARADASPKHLWRMTK